MNSQGRDTNTVLTNLSNYLTVVSKEPYNERKLQRYGLPALRSSHGSGHQSVPRSGRRGLRPLHRTTLKLGDESEHSKYASTMKDSFSGRHDIHALEQFKKCPSQHTSQFHFGGNSHLNITTSDDCFIKYPVHSMTTHVDRSKWLSQMSGKEMMSCTRHDDSRNMDFATTYSQNHRRFPQDNSNKSDRFNGRWRTSIYKICNGPLQVNNATTFQFNLVSGNQILSEARKKSQTNILC